MMYVIPPYTGTHSDLYYIWDGAFNNDELNHLENLAKQNKDNAEVGAGKAGAVRNETRRSKVSWLEATSETNWIYKKLSHAVASVNANIYKFNLTGFGEALQITLYEGSENGMYNWHQDYGSIVSRKLSLVLQLTDPSMYEGGNLELLNAVGEPVVVQKRRGLIALFPSYITHRVTPVTSGRRATLVSWVSGPPFK